MPFSNYGPLVDPNAPPTVQALYQGTNPDFCFQSPSPYNKIGKTKAVTKLIADFVVLGVVAYSILNNKALQGIPWKNLLSTLLTDLKTTGDEEIVVYIAGALIIFVGLSYIVGILSNIIKLFVNDQLWYIGTSTKLLISNTKKSDSIIWQNFKNPTDYQSTPTGDTLSLKLKSGTILLSVIQKNKNLAQTFNSIDIINPPNVMEVKRIIEKHIQSNMLDTEDKELQEFLQAEKEAGLRTPLTL